MAKTQDKEMIRQKIIAGAQIYSKELAGNVFFYDYNGGSFELFFPARSFLHLTGVATAMAARQFYQIAKKGQLRRDQFSFSADHPYDLAKKKAPCLVLLPELTRSLVCIVTDFKTLTFKYAIGVTNLNFTLGLSENTDKNGAILNNWYIPRTLRVGDDAISNSTDGFLVNRILVRDASKDTYSTVLFDINNMT